MCSGCSCSLNTFASCECMYGNNRCDVYEDRPWVVTPGRSIFQDVSGLKNAWTKICVAIIQSGCKRAELVEKSVRWKDFVRLELCCVPSNGLQTRVCKGNEDAIIDYMPPWEQTFAAPQAAARRRMTAAVVFEDHEARKDASVKSEGIHWHRPKREFRQIACKWTGSR